MRSRLFTIPVAIFFALSCVFTTMSLQAGGFGKTEEVFEREGTTWNGVYFDMNGFKFVASLPNYSGASLQNGDTSLRGHIDHSFGYEIQTSFNAGFNPPRKEKEFLKMIQKANPSCVVKLVDSKGFGAKYAVDLVPKDKNNATYWRFISTKDRLIKMGTNDSNESHRLCFFDSITIH